MRRLVALGCLLVAPSLWLGFVSDDHVLLAALEGARDGSGPLSLYDLVPRDPARVAAATARGFTPWWTSPALSLTFLRPLSSALFALDHLAFGRAAWAYHLHALLWLALLLGAQGRLLARLRPAAEARLALALLCVDDAHALAVGWLSNRHALVGCALAFWAFESWLAARDSGRPRLAWLAAAGFAAALLSSELAIACLAFPCAVTLSEPTRSLRARLRDALPWLAPLALYGAVYVLLGCGAHDSGAYLSPGDPTDLARALTRLPALLADLAWNAPAVLWFLGAPARAAQALAAALAVAGWLRWGRADATMRPLAWGALLALVPAALALPSSRQLLAASFGAAACIAHITLKGVLSLHAPARMLGLCLAALHLVAAPALLLVGQFRLHAVERQVRVAAASLDGLPGCTAEGTTTVLLAAPDHTLGVYVPATRRTLGRPAAPLYVLSMAPYDQRVRAVDDHTLRLDAAGPLFVSPIEAFWRKRPLAAGTTVETAAFSAHVEGPRALTFRFRAPLASPRLCFVRYEAGRFVRVDVAHANEHALPKRPGPSGL